MLTPDQEKAIDRIVGKTVPDLYSYVDNLLAIAQAKRRMREEFTTEWEVCWFPPGRKTQRRTYVTEAKARDRYAVASELGHAPILSSREVVTRTSGWTTIENATQEAS